MSKDQPTLFPELAAQDAYLARQRAAGFDFDIVVADAFVRSIRDIGYRSTATALDELIDNSKEAGADRILIAFGYDRKSDRNPSQIAVIDNGHGMRPDMIRAAVMWGGTHREGSREGFGRYGYGLPSSSVSQGTRFTVFSKPPDGELHKVTFDLEALQQGAYRNTATGSFQIPAAERTSLPSWLSREIMAHFRLDELQHGTVVLLEELDRLTWVSELGLERNLLQHIGVTYRNFLQQLNIIVNGKTVQPVDPLFLTPGARFYDLDEDRAEARDPLTIDIPASQTKSRLPGQITVRFSYLPPTFASVDKSLPATRGNANERFAVMKEHNGIIVMRHGRQIDVVRTNPWLVFQTNDRYWGVEVDFTPSLDEEFSVTTSKQQIIPSERIWTLLKNHGVERAISEMRKNYRFARGELEQKRDEAANGERPSEQAMQEAEKFRPRKPSLARMTEGEVTLNREAERRARQAGVPVEVVREELEVQAEQHPYRVETEQVPGAPFYRVAQVGGMVVLYLNTTHRFFQDVYQGPHSNAYMRAALELLLFVMGDAELDAVDDRRTFYEVERGQWSTKLSVTLAQLENALDLLSVKEAAAAADDDAPSGQEDELALFRLGETNTRGE